MSPDKSIVEVLFEAFDTGWGRPMPVKVLTYSDGSQDLHRQTGTEFVEAIERAKVILAQRGLQVAEPSYVGPTGIYMSISAISVKKPELAVI